MPSTPRPLVVVNLTNTRDVADRMSAERPPSLPGWFALAIRHAGFDVALSLNPIGAWIRALLSRRPLHALCFNPSSWYLLIFLLPARGKRVCLYQWRPLSRLAPLRFLRAYLLLALADAVVVYDPVAARYIRRIFRTKAVVQIGLYTDTDFFKPGADASNDRPAAGAAFILAPGDHLRQERYFRDLAECSGLRVVRVTRNAHVAERVQQDSHAGVELVFDTTYEQLRELYRTAAAVAVFTDSAEVPIGITTCFEALACGATVILTPGRCAAALGRKSAPVYIWPPDRTARAHRHPGLPGRLPCADGRTRSLARKTALESASLTTVSQQWLSVFGDPAQP